MILNLNPAKWFAKKPVAPTVVAQLSTTAKAVNGESIMSTAAVIPAPAENGFERFVDKFKAFIKNEAPLADKIANAAKPILALTPIGPEYNLALTAIETAVRADAAVQSASAAPLTGTQQMALAVQVASAGLKTILASKGVTEPTTVSTAITQFLQNVYNMQLGPVVVNAPAPATPTP